MAGNTVEFNDANFEQEVLKSELPVLVDFWAPWCGPCRMIAPSIEALSTEYAGKVKIGKLNSDDNPDVSAKFGIRSTARPKYSVIENVTPVIDGRW